YVIRGLADEHLLDTYSGERVYATRENLCYGTNSTEFMAPPTFAFELLRTAVLTLALNHSEVRPLINPRQTATITYLNSPLNHPDVDKEWFSNGPVPGAVLVESPVTIQDDDEASQAHLTDLIAPVFTVMLFTDGRGGSADTLKLQSAMDTRGVPFRVLTLAATAAKDASVDAWDESGRLFQMYCAALNTCYLVRPDGHVLGRWKNFEPAVIEAAVEAVLATRELEVAA